MFFVIILLLLLLLSLLIVYEFWAIFVYTHCIFIVIIINDRNVQKNTFMTEKKKRKSTINLLLTIVITDLFIYVIDMI